MRQISVLLTKYSDWISTLVYYAGGRGYTHSSIALEEAEGIYYSFNFRGFAVETAKNHQRRGVKKSRCYRIQVPDEAYERIRERIWEFLKNREKYRYTRLGLFLCMIRFPFSWKNHYFCSHFVAELLADSGAVPLRKRASLYLPNHFPADLEAFSGCRQVQCSVI